MRMQRTKPKVTYPKRITPGRFGLCRKGPYVKEIDYTHEVVRCYIPHRKTRRIAHDIIDRLKDSNVTVHISYNRLIVEGIRCEREGKVKTIFVLVVTPYVSGKSTSSHLDPFNYVTPPWARPVDYHRIWEELKYDLEGKRRKKKMKLRYCPDDD